MKREIDYKALGRKIAEMRRIRGLSQAELAEMIDCETTHVSNIENNHTQLSLNALLAIANALGTSIDFLLLDQYSQQKAVLELQTRRKMEEMNEYELRVLIDIMDAMIRNR